MKVKLYMNTGFNSENIPDSIKLLEDAGFSKLVYENYNLIQSDWLAQLTISEITSKQARTVDYIVVEIEEDPIYEKTCYVVTDFKMKTKHTCTFYLQIDPYNSMGGFALDSGNLIMSGSVERCHVSIEEDNQKFYILDEPFKPSERCLNSYENLYPLSDNVKPRIILETLTVPPMTISPALDDGNTKIMPKPLMLPQQQAEIAKKLFQSYAGTSIGANATEVEIDGEKSLIYTKAIDPVLRPLEPTTYKFKLLNGNIKDISLGSRLWFNDDDANTNNKGIKYKNLPFKINDNETVNIDGDLVKDMRSTGRDDDIVAYYEIPKEYIDEINNDAAHNYNPINPDASNIDRANGYGGIYEIGNKVINKTKQFVPPTQIYNNKCRYSQSCTAMIYNPCSGENITKKLYEIANSWDSPATPIIADMIISADIRVNGTPIFSWKYLNGTDVTAYQPEILKGASWRNLPLNVEGTLKGEYAERKKLDIGNNERIAEAMGQAVNKAINSAIAGSTVGTVGAVAGGISGAFAGALEVANIYRQNQLRVKELETESVMASAQLNISSSDYARELGLNTFFLVYTQYSQQDMIDYDTFLTKYGYNMGNKPITNNDFYSRPAFNFIKIHDISIKSVTASQTLINMVKEQLQAGVRIWHRAPNPQDMLASGNRA